MWAHRGHSMEAELRGQPAGLGSLSFFCLSSWDHTCIKERVLLPAELSGWTRRKSIYFLSSVLLGEPSRYRHNCCHGPRGNEAKGTGRLKGARWRPSGSVCSHSPSIQAKRGQERQATNPGALPVTPIYHIFIRNANGPSVYALDSAV